jgi:hypothetical protein
MKFYLIFFTFIICCIIWYWNNISENFEGDLELQSHHLQVYDPSSRYEKKRIGKNNDGGYVVCLIPNVQYDVFLSGGINTDVSFEEDFLKHYPNLTCHAFDGTVDSLPENTIGNIIFHKKNLSNVNSNDKSNWREYFDKYHNMFIKLDIEGGENELFSSLSKNDLLKIKQLVIEFHSSNQIDIPKRLSETHWLVHFHGNNCDKTVETNGIIIPNVFECTFIRRDNETFQKNTRIIPDIEFDQPNCTNSPDIQLYGHPFN